MLNGLYLKTLLMIFFPDDFGSCYWQLLRPFITQCIPSCKNFDWRQWDNTFNYSSSIKIFQYYFYHLLLLSKQQTLSTYNQLFFFLRNSLPGSQILHIKMPVTTSLRCRMSWIYFHTSEIFMKQMFKHKLLLHNLILLDEREIRWEPMMICRKPEVITLDLL